MIRVIIADDNGNVRAYVRKQVKNSTDIVLVGEAADGEEAIRVLEKTPADILLLDIEMPRMNGFEVLQQIKLSAMDIRVVIFSGYIDRQLIIGSFELGARGYLVKEEAPSCLLRAIRAVFVGGENWTSTSAAQSLGF